MSYIKLEKFSGLSPRTAPTQLTPNQAQTAKNVRVTSGSLQSWKLETKEYEPVGSTTLSTIYKLQNQTTNAYKWLGWTTDVDVVIGPVGDLTESRIYYTGDGAPKKTNWNLATTSGSGAAPYPNSWLYMGVPSPTVAPTLIASSASGTTETRAYTYTNISTFGAITEESAPSPAATIVVTSVTGTVTVSGFSAAPTTGYNITHRRIYRTITGATSVVYNLVAEIPVSTTSYVDSISAANLGIALSSLYYTPPPTDLKGLVAMPNGILVGFRGNEIWFCEPYLPHAWPSIYMLTVNDEVVGLGVYDINLVVTTKHQPFIITGANPGAMSQSKLSMMQPCVSKRSITADQYGVIYASPNGLVGIGPGSQDVITAGLYTREEWQKILPETLISKVYNNMYIGFATLSGTTSGLVFSRADIPPLFVWDFQANAVYVDHASGAIYAVSKIDNAIYKLDSDPYNFTFYEWKSKQFVLPNPVNFAAMKVQAEYDSIKDSASYNALVAQIIASNQTLFASSSSNLRGTLNGNYINEFVVNGSILQDIPPFEGARSVNIFLYADGQLVYTTGMYSTEPVRLPVSTKAYKFEIKITGNVPVSGVLIAGSIGELKNLVNG
jgi:hypothetical protein